MKVTQKGNTTIVKDTNDDLTILVTNLTNQYKTFESQNLIIDISNHKNLIDSLFEKKEDAEFAISAVFCGIS